MWREFNPNPSGARVGDCAVRAISAALGMDWEQTYLELCIEGLLHHDLPSANAVWGRHLIRNGFKRGLVKEDSVRSFGQNHPNGTYVLALSGHVVTMIDGTVFDTWDSSECQPLYCYYKEIEP